MWHSIAQLSQDLRSTGNPMPLSENTICQLCGGSSFKILYSGLFRALLCKNCSLVFLDGIRRDLKKLYSDYGNFEKENTRVNNALFRWIQRNLPQIGGLSVLEIGCGGGHLLRRFAEAGMRTTGVDASVRASEFAKWRNKIGDIRCSMLGVRPSNDSVPANEPV